MAGCGCLALAQAALAEGGPANVPEGYTPPAPVRDLTKAPGMRARLIDGGDGRARTYAVIFGKGDEIMSGMTALAQREHLADGHFTAIGAIQSGLMGWFDRDRKAYKNIPVESQAEVASLIGDIGLVSGKSSVHIHAVVAMPDGTTKGGHLLHAIVWPTLELFLSESPTPLNKQHDAETGLDLFNLES